MRRPKYSKSVLIDILIDIIHIRISKDVNHLEFTKETSNYKTDKILITQIVTNKLTNIIK